MGRFVTMGSVFDGLDGASEAEIEALMRDAGRLQASRVLPDVGETQKLRIVLPGKSKGPIGRFEPEIRNLNDDVEVVVRLPGYMVAEIAGRESLEIREALREHLKARGVWAYPRFLMDVQARAMRARDTFTRRSRLD